MFRWTITALVLLAVGCSPGQETVPLPTLMVLPGQMLNDQGQIITVTPSPRPPEATSTALPQVVGVPTPTPAYGNLGTLIAKLVSGETRGGAFDEASLSHVYIFSGAVGDYVNVEMRRISGEVDPVITLFSPSGAPLATDDNSGGDRSAMLRNIRLPEEGLYSIQATGDGLFGGYVLTLVSSAAPIPVTPIVPDVTPTATHLPEVLTPTLARAIPGNRLEDHVPVIGSLSREGDFGRFPLYASEGEIVAIGASPAPGYDLRLKLEVFGPAGDLVASAASTTSNAGGDALISPLLVKETGAHLVYVSAELPATGLYTIAYGSGWTYQNVMRGEAPSNRTNEGEIARPGLRDLWSVYLNANDVITVAADAEDSPLDPFLEVAKASGELVAVDDNSGAGGNALITQARIPETGLYHLRVQAAQGATTGKYALIWRYVNLASTPTPLPAAIPVLSVDAIAPDNAYLFYPFQGRAGQRVEVSVVASAGADFDPVAVLIGPDGATVAEADDSGGSLYPRFVATLPADGTYTVRVNGYLKGGPFVLTVNEVL